MIIGLIGARGTIPTSKTATVSFIVDNKYLFECPSEIIQAFHKFQTHWLQNKELSKHPEITALGKPTLSKIKYIILSHLHYDHWGGLAHVIHRIMLLEREMRQNEPLKLIIPEHSTLPFQQRLNLVFEGSIQSSYLPDDEFLYRLLTIEVGSSVREILEITIIKNNETISLDQNYILSGIENNHLESGSFSFKLEFIKIKLNADKARKLGIPFNKTLKLIEKSYTPIKVGNKQISREDIFFDVKTILCYSGDTQLDSELFSFFHDCHILFHEATYLTPDERYHLESHSDVQSLLTEVEKLPNLQIFVPLHFSIRYKEEEISKFLNSFSNNSYQIVDPLNIFLIQIESSATVKLIKKY